MYSLLDQYRLEQSLVLLSHRLARMDAAPIQLVVCGGAALIAQRLVARTTTDVDIVALVDANGRLAAPVPFPEALSRAAREVASILDLPAHWLNNEPSKDAGGLFQMGLPDGFQERLHARHFGQNLTVFFVDRIDQIHFKLYAAVDRGGYHLSDLEALSPATVELVTAARWAFTHDVSPAFRQLTKALLEDLGHSDAAEQL